MFFVCILTPSFAILTLEERIQPPNYKKFKDKVPLNEYIHTCS